jgi:lambda family phage portal protein
MNFFGKQIAIPFLKRSIPAPVKMLPPKNEPSASYGYGNRSGYGRGYGTNYKSSGAKWNGGLSQYVSHMTYDHWALRQNGRNIAHDSVNAHGLVKRWADSIADTGLKLDCNPNFKLLGITPEEAEKWASDVEMRFNLWANDQKQCRSNVMNFMQSHRFYQKNKKRDGENFIRFYYSKDKNLLNPLQFEFIDPNQIRGDAVTTTLGPYAIADGIERDERGREKSYKIWNSKLVNGVYSYSFETIPRIGVKSKRIMMLHCFEPEYPGQKRGFSGLAHFIQEFEKLTDFTAAEIQKAINQSNVVMSIQNNMQDPSNPTEDMPISPPGGQAFGVKASDSNAECETDDVCGAHDIQYNALNEVDLSVPGSTAYFNTRMGDKIEPFKNTAPSTGYKDFVDAFLGNLASSDGMPLSVLKMKMDSSYSAARGELLMFWRSIIIEQKEFSSDYLNPTFKMWLSEEIAAGRVSAPGWNDPIMQAAWLNCDWIGGPMPNIDPLRTAKGVKEYLTMSATTGERIAREYNGSDFKSNIMKNEVGFNLMPTPFWEQKNQGGF